MSESIELSLETLPHSLTMEQAVIGGLLTGEGWEDVSGILTDADFYSPRHAVMYRAIASLHGIGQAVDPLTMLDWLISNHLDLLAGGEEYLCDLVRNTPSNTHNLSPYARRVHDLAVRRRLHAIGETIRTIAADGTRELPDLLSESDAMISALLAGRVGSGIRMTGGVQLMRDVFNDAIRASENPGISGITTGLSELDEKSDGLQKGNSIVVAAPPSMGKTAFAMSLVLAALPHVKHPIVVFSIEMPALNIGRRMVANVSRTSYTSIKRGFVFSENGGADGSRMTQRMSVLQTENLIICDESGLTPAMMRAVLRGVAKRHGGVSMAVVDYIQLMDANKALPNNRNQELTAISRDIKRMAMDFNMPFVVISQLTKDVEKLKRRPTNGDLRESGAIAQDADMILMVHRQEKYEANPGHEHVGKAEIIITKNRNGECGTVHCGYDGSTFRFHELGPESW
jgi:replicative DNA helicase